MLGWLEDCLDAWVVGGLFEVRKNLDVKMGDERRKKGQKEYKEKRQKNAT